VQVAKKKKKREAGDQMVPIEAQCTERTRKTHNQEYDLEEDKANG